ncbi:MAG: glycosyltransferase [Bacteroidota bacterium]|nr:glycosyltransferase [Bacteroidota bacterium]
MNYYIQQFFSQHHIIQILFYIAAGSALIQLFYYLFFYARVFGFKRRLSENHNYSPLSVIICAKNEKQNLEKFLVSVLEQDYGTFEVIVVDDASEDKSVDFLNSMKEKYENLYVTYLEANNGKTQGKKMAVTIGVKAAQYEYMVFTDADCKPQSRYWLQAIADSYSDSTDIVLGYGAYFKSGGLLNKIIRYDTMFIAMQYMSFAKAGFPYMGVGRNLSYTKTIYNSVKGFSSHYHIMSGDDDLFVNQTANKRNTQIVTTPESITHSEPKTSFSDLVKQKRRHFTSSKRYKAKHKLLLGLEIFSRVLFYSALIVLFTMGAMPELIAGIYGTRFIVKHLVLGRAVFVFKEKDLIFFSFLFDILIPLINIWTLVSKYFIKNKIKTRW